MVDERRMSDQSIQYLIKWADWVYQESTWEMAHMLAGTTLVADWRDLPLVKRQQRRRKYLNALEADKREQRRMDRRATKRRTVACLLRLTEQKILHCCDQRTKEAALRMLRRGVVPRTQKRSDCTIHGECRSELKEDLYYKLSVVLNKANATLENFQCTCPAYRSNDKMLCKHLVAALLVRVPASKRAWPESHPASTVAEEKQEMAEEARITEEYIIARRPLPSDNSSAAAHAGNQYLVKRMGRPMASAEWRSQESINATLIRQWESMDRPQRRRVYESYMGALEGQRRWLVEQSSRAKLAGKPAPVLNLDWQRIKEYASAEAVALARQWKEDGGFVRTKKTGQEIRADVRVPSDIIPFAIYLQVDETTGQFLHWRCDCGAAHNEGGNLCPHIVRTLMAHM